MRKRNKKWTVEFGLNPPVLIDNVNLVPNIILKPHQLIIEFMANVNGITSLYAWFEKTYNLMQVKDYKINVTFVHNLEPSFTLVNAWPISMNWNSLDMTTDVTTFELTLSYDKII
jgi:hypothetical protein